MSVIIGIGIIGADGHANKRCAIGGHSSEAFAEDEEARRQRHGRGTQGHSDTTGHDTERDTEGHSDTQGHDKERDTKGHDVERDTKGHDTELDTRGYYVRDDVDSMTSDEGGAGNSDGKDSDRSILLEGARVRGRGLRGEAPHRLEGRGDVRRGDVRVPAARGSLARVDLRPEKKKQVQRCCTPASQSADAQTRKYARAPHTFTPTYFAHSLIHALTHPLTHSRTHSLTHLRTRSLTHLLTHLPTHLLTHSLIH